MITNNNSNNSNNSNRKYRNSDFNSNRGPKRQGPYIKSGFFQQRPKKPNEEEYCNSPSKLDMSKKGIYMVALSGTRDFEANATLYCVRGKWILVDIGIGFQCDAEDGIGVVLPNLDFLRSIPREDFLGLFITHGHEDHLGGVHKSIFEIQKVMREQDPEDKEKSWRLPIYSSSFTISLLEKKLEDVKSDEEALMHRVEPNEVIDLGPFSVTFISATHSIPDNSMLAIKARIDDEGQEAVVLHTGDWRFDHSPVVGEVSDFDALKALQKENVIAVVCDSTHAMTPGNFKSEKDVKESLGDMIKKIKKGRVVIVCFSTNVSRVDSAARIAASVGRKVVLLGRSLQRIQEVSIAHKYLDGLNFITEDESSSYNREQLLFVCAGSQGEQKSGLRRLADQQHNKITLEEGDTVIISARQIPGNEKKIDQMKNKFAERGINVITADDDSDIHVSGHPPQEDLKELYRMVMPKTVVPVHGTSIAMLAHEKLAVSQGIKSVFTKNGEVLFLGPTSDPVVSKTPRGMFVKTTHLKDVLTVCGMVKTGKLGIDGRAFVPMDGTVVKDRKALKFGHCVISYSAKPESNYSIEIIMRGVCEEYEEDYKRALLNCIYRAADKIAPESRTNPLIVKPQLYNAALNFIFSTRFIEPCVDVVMHMPRGSVFIEAAHSVDYREWTLKILSAECGNPEIVKTIEKSLNSIAQYLCIKNRTKIMHEDRLFDSIRDGIDNCLRKSFDQHLRPYIGIKIVKPE